MRQQITGLCCAMLIILSCGAAMAQTTPEATEPSATPELVGVTWQWQHHADGKEAFDVPQSENYTITFTEDGEFHAKADCNYVNGTYTAEDGSITITPIQMTRVACAPDSLGDKFTQTLGFVVIYSFTDNGELLLEAPADSGTMLFTAQPQVTGTVTYRPRIALPPDAIVRVQLQDVSLADAPTVILGEDVIVTDGAQVPILFAVPYSEAAIEEGSRYSLSARISDDEGNLLFISTTYIPVITGDHPTSDVEIVVMQVQ